MVERKSGGAKGGKPAVASSEVSQQQQASSAITGAPPAIHSSSASSSGLRPPSLPSSLNPPSRQQLHGRNASGTTSYAGSTQGARTPTTSRPNSPRHSVFPAGSTDWNIVDIKSDMMVNWLYEQQLRRQYASGMDAYEGVVLKKARGNFTCCPAEMSSIPGSLYAMVARMNVRCAMTVNTPVVRAILGSLRSKETMIDYVPLAGGLRVQILRTMADLPRCQLHHFAAFIEDVSMLVVWDDEPEKLPERAQTLEMRFMELIWSSGDGEDDETHDEKAPQPVVAETELDPDQLEEALTREHRPIRLESAAIVGLTLALCIICISFGWRYLAIEIMVDGSYTRLALVAAAPVQMFASLVSFYLGFPLPLACPDEGC